MPLSQRELDEEGVPIRFQSRGEVLVRNGLGASHHPAPTIALNGACYICGGEIILLNGRRLDAHFELDTRAAGILSKTSVWCTLDGDLFYLVSERSNRRDLLRAMGLSSAEAFPYSWVPPRPLDPGGPGPFSVHWPMTHQPGPAGIAARAIARLKSTIKRWRVP